MPQNGGGPDVHRDQAGWRGVGAHLLNTSMGNSIEVTCWRERNHEVDCVLHRGKTTGAIEAKSTGCKVRDQGRLHL